MPLIVDRLRRALRRHGLAGTARRAARELSAMRERQRYRAVERAFDRLHGVETEGIVRLQTLTIESPNREHGVRYQASDPDHFRDLLRRLPIDYRDFVFVDFGAGKGRALLLASEFPFKRVVGVEFSPELTEIARRNVAGFRSDRQHCHEFELVCADALDYELPDEPAILYFYNPFTETVLRRVLERSAARSTTGRGRCSSVVTGDAPLHAIVDEGFASLARAGEPESHALRGRRVFVPVTATVTVVATFFARLTGRCGADELSGLCGL